MRNNYIAAFLLLLGTSLLGGCANDIESDEPNKEIDGLIPINIVMQGYQDFEEDIPETKVRNSNGDSHAIRVFRQDMDMPGYEDYEIVTTVESTSIQEIQTRANMNTNARFRMLVYNASAIVVADCQYQVNGTTATLVEGIIPQLAEGTYKFVCYTKNTTTVSTTAMVNVNNGDDFATCCITKAISAADNTIPITFKRQISQFSITAAATGFTNNTVTFASADVASLYNVGTWNVNYNSNDTEGLAVSETATLSCINNTSYKVLPVARTMSLILKNLSVDGVEKGDKAVNFTTQFMRGKNYKVTVNFTKRDAILLAGLYWATGNLIGDGNVYRFHNSQEQYSGVWNGGDYFNFNVLGSLDYSTSVVGSVYNIANDPCRKVIPAGTWKTPTQAELTTLVNLPNVWGQLNGRYGRYFGPNNELFLPGAGWRYKTTSVTSSGSAGLYWSSTPVGSSGSAVSLGIDTRVAHIDARSHRAIGESIRCVQIR